MSTKREEMLRKKAEDEARKAGTLPPEKDSRGQIINPHIPEFMAKVPWYMQSGEDNQVGLDHQRLPENKKDHSDIGMGWYDRGQAAKAKQPPPNQRFEKGACTNCGAKTHNAKNCLEKPRKLGASQLGKRLAQDDTVLPDLHLSYDGKRDNYNGFSAETQLAQVQQRKLLKLQQQAGNETTATTSSAASALPSNTLRVRTDTAKYLRNLDPESAFYDPKTRSMRANPTPHLDSAELSFAGDNFIKNSGEVQEFEEVEEFAQGNLMANPTAIALQRKQFVQLVKKGEEEAMAKRKATELEYTGGDTSSAAAGASALPSSSTCYFEYTKDGRLVNNGDTDIVPSSRFEEDVFEGNHSQIWGSYLDDCTLQWGYSCCFQTIRKSYCIGERGREAVREAKLRMQQAKEGTLVVAQDKPIEAPPPKREKTRAVVVQHDDDASSDSSSSDWNTSSDEEDDDGDEKRSKKRKSSKKKKKKSHKSHKKSRKHDKRDKVDKPPQQQQSFQGGGFQPEDNEQMRQSRIRPGDPMMGSLG